MKQRQTLRLAGLSFVYWLMTAGWAAAEETVDSPMNDKPPVIPASSITGYLIWVIFALLLVIGLIVLVIKLLSKRSRGWGANRSLRSLGGIPLGQNKSLQVVELSGRIYVVGVGENVSLLDKIDDPVEAQMVLDDMQQQTGQVWNATSLKDMVGRFRNRNTDSSAGPNDERWQESESFQTLLNNRMKRQAENKQKMEELLKEQNQNDRLLDE
ncbi:flagellar biosynthetic protein FliO [Paenibacillus spongiae]|uniref:Flagellar biosynthetic protein FliO n=1 Tax=Paenibacillus spongiae TaxID=2909671 RepID=A0ABY5SFG0_9BACL|nr:flagellar biosynthetic protein FliO [Paenibacillus spongiae]UVI32509.1 flagellar biosynthetic protein FliO [Paenibacillus spongiae]